MEPISVSWSREGRLWYAILLFKLIEIFDSLYRLMWCFEKKFLHTQL